MTSTILLIDDEELVIKSIAKLLTKEGYEVIICRSGEQALATIRERDVDLIITDVRMPGMSGVETIRRIREHLNQSKRNPIREILVTGYAEEEVNREVEALQVSDYIYKPFDLRQFLDCVKKNLNGV